MWDKNETPLINLFTCFRNEIVVRSHKHKHTYCANYKRNVVRYIRTSKCPCLFWKWCVRYSPLPMILLLLLAVFLPKIVNNFTQLRMHNCAEIARRRRCNGSRPKENWCNLLSYKVFYMFRFLFHRLRFIGQWHNTICSFFNENTRAHICILCTHIIIMCSCTELIALLCTSTSAHMQWIKMCIQENAQITHRKQKKKKNEKKAKQKDVAAVVV